MSLKLLPVAILTACVALAGCDEQQSDRAVQKLKEFFNAVKPDALLLKDMTPGVTTEAQIRDQMGKPETERTFTDGSKRFEYPCGPQGLNTYMVDIGRDGKLQAIMQVLTAKNFAKIRMGMTEDEVRRLLGKSGEMAVFPLKPETVWSWKWRERGVTEEGIFNVHFDQYHKVYTTSRSDVIPWAIDAKKAGWGMIRRRRYSRIGLVLGGGAARGWAHIGAVYANGDLDWLEEWVSRLTWQTVVRLLDLRLSGGLCVCRADCLAGAR
ncbi:MAG: putative lipoprotein [uncultured Paraburkholderia sp.]|nr:MAG: putative lipoprotein [uncultured Paraburkholderia sp.]CAH2937599.1 MAG: putative lipoprotein [uncultured Paraburkholderia sp.]